MAGISLQFLLPWDELRALGNALFSPFLHHLGNSVLLGVVVTAKKQYRGNFGTRSKYRCYAYSHSTELCVYAAGGILLYKQDRKAFTRGLTA